MTIQAGKDVLLKMRKANNSYTTVAGLRTKSLTLNAQPVNVSHADSAGRWRELLQESGLRTLDVSGQGIFKDVASDEMVRDAFFRGATNGWQMVLPDFGTLSGDFLIVSLSYAGAYDSELRWDIELQSAGEITFAAIK